MVNEGFLQWMKVVPASEALHRLNLSPFHLRSQYETGVDRDPIQQDCAGTTFTNPATLFRSGKTQLFTKESKERPVGRDLHLNPTPIYLKLDHSMHPIFGSLSSAKFEV